MAVINCPKCEARMRFPDDSPERMVKCPACQHSFLAGPGGAAAGKPGTKEEPKPPQPDDDRGRRRRDEDDDRDRRKRDEDDDRGRRRRDDDDDRDRDRGRRRRDEDDDRDRRKRDEDDDRGRRRRDDDDDRDRDRDRRRRDEDDDRDRPRRRRDEDDDRDRPRRRRDEDDRDRDRGRDDDDVGRRDDYNRKSSKQIAAEIGRARLAMQLIGIASWVHVGALGGLVLLAMFLLMGVYEPALNALAGLPGLGAFLTAAVGIGFLIAGPKKGNLFGLTIALASVSFVHLVFIMVMSFQSNTIGAGYRYSTGVDWQSMVTLLHGMAFQMLIVAVFETLRVLSLIGGLFEIARFVLLMLVIKELARFCKGRDGSQVEKMSRMLLILQPAAVGLAMVIYLMYGLIAKNTRGSGEGVYLGFFFLLIELGAYIGIGCMTAILCGQVQKSITVKK